jgi:hypothetical protein
MGSRFFRSYACNLPSSFNAVLSSALVYSTRPPVSVSGTVCTVELFPGTASLPSQSSKTEQVTQSVTTTRPTNINVVPIDYAFRPRLRGRLTLLRLTLSRNPWSFGEGVSHSLYRYSCQHSHFRYLQKPSRVFLRRLTERSATTCTKCTSSASVHGLSPVTFSAQNPLFRPVSCYAFFK